MAETNNEQFEQIQAPTTASADIVNDKIKSGDYEGAKEYSQKVDFTDEKYEEFSKTLDQTTLPESESNKSPLTPEEYESVQKEKLYKQIDEYGVEHDPAMRFVERSNEAISENQQLIDELLKLIKKAKNQAKYSREAHRWGVNVVPVIGSVYGLIKSSRFKTNLKKIEKLYNQLNNDQIEIAPTLQADKISPSRGQGKQLVGIAGTVGGSVVLGPLGAIPGIITAIYGGFQSFKSFEETGQTSANLEKLETELTSLRTQDEQALGALDETQEGYREAAFENLQGLSAN